MPQPSSSALTENGYVRRWWKEAVVYQVYPRSFRDSNGDGIGDLAGILEKLDYISGLGVDVIWLSPHFDSPNADNGYDIRDYRKVMAEFGTMADFDALLAGIKARGMRLIIDLVVNHTSDEHEWFVESRTGKDSPYRDFYIWREGRNGGPPNNWRSFFSEPAWTLDPSSGEYYLHLFAKKQPDLNWENPAVRAEVFDVMRFWLDKGVDGFRMDVIPFISKDRSFADYGEPYHARPQDFYAAGPKLHDFLQEMNGQVLSRYDAMTVGEASGVSLADTPLLVDERRNELNMVFQFDVVQFDRGPGGVWRSWTLPEFKAIFARHAAGLDRHCWPTVFLSNHDSPRPVSRYGNDAPQWRVSSAKALALLLLTQKGTPFIYQGDELGMTNFPFERVEQFEDIAVRNAWSARLASGDAGEQAFVANLNKTSRDHSRTPMQWSAAANAGFTSAVRPWLAVNPNYPTLNADQAVADTHSVYHFFRELIAIRRNSPALIYGDYRDLLPDHPQLFAFSRTLGNETFLTVINFSEDECTFDIDALPDLEPVLANGPRPLAIADGQIVLGGWSAGLFRTRAAGL